MIVVSNIIVICPQSKFQDSLTIPMFSDGKTLKAHKQWFNLTLKRSSCRAKSKFEEIKISPSELMSAILSRIQNSKYVGATGNHNCTKFEEKQFSCIA